MGPLAPLAEPAGGEARRHNYPHPGAPPGPPPPKPPRLQDPGRGCVPGAWRASCPASRPRRLRIFGQPGCSLRGAKSAPAGPGEARPPREQAEAQQCRLLNYDSAHLTRRSGNLGSAPALRLRHPSPRQAGPPRPGDEDRAAGSGVSTAIHRLGARKLAWRSFLPEQALFHFPALARRPLRAQWRSSPWENDPVRFGPGARPHGVAIVDAAMRSSSTPAAGCTTACRNDRPPPFWSGSDHRLALGRSRPSWSGLGGRRSWPPTTAAGE